MSLNPDHVAVLTGDIVKSTTLSRAERDTVFAALSAGAEAVASLQEMPARFTRFSGDSWQMLVQPRFALRASLLMRSYIKQEDKNFETRISVGVGAIEPLSTEGLGASDGPAFQASGRGLEALGGPFYFSINTDDSPVFTLADELSKRWTTAQARVLCKALTLPVPTQDSLASYIGVSRHTVRNHLIAAGGPALIAVMEWLEAKSSP